MPPAASPCLPQDADGNIVANPTYVDDDSSEWGPVSAPAAHV